MAQSLIVPPLGPANGELLRAALVAVTAAGIFTVAEVWRARANPAVESTRKLVHFANGVLCMFLPWLIGSPWTLLALSAGSAGTLAVARRLKLLQSVLGVERRSAGDVLFPIAVFLLFLVARHNAVFYLISMVTLVACDSLAAILGGAYGRHGYTVEGDRKSLEGSGVFLLTAFLGVHLPLLLLTPIDRAASVIISLQLALLVTSFEAISSRGWDNLFVPLGTFYLLVKLTSKTADQITLQLGVQLAILAVTLLVARRTRLLTFSGALAAHLVLYSAYSLGGPRWIVAPLLTLAAFIWLEVATHRITRVERGGHQVAAIFYVSVVAVVLLFADNTRDILMPNTPHLTIQHPFYVPFVGALAGAASAAALMLGRLLPWARSAPPAARAVSAALFGFLLVGPLSLWSNGALRLEPLWLVLGMCLATLVLFRIGNTVLRWPRELKWDLRLVALAIFVATIGAVPLHLAWLASGVGRAP